MLPAHVVHLAWSDLGAAVAACGAVVHERSPLKRYVLQGVGPDVGSGRAAGLDPALLPIVRAVASPTRILSMAVVGAGLDREVHYVEDADGTNAVLTPGPTGGEFIACADRAAGLAHLLRWLTVDTNPPLACSLSMSGVAFASLLASADASQAAAMRSRLSRTLPRKPVLTADLLDGELSSSTQSDDASWILVAARRASVPFLEGVDGRMAEGLDMLHRSGLAEPVSRGFVLISDGQRLCDALARVVACARVTVSLLTEGRWVESGSTLFCGAAGAVLATPTPQGLSVCAGHGAIVDHLGTMLADAAVLKRETRGTKAARTPEAKRKVGGARAKPVATADAADAADAAVAAVAAVAADAADAADAPSVVPAADGLPACGACGKATTRAGQKFCGYCAAEIPQAPEPGRCPNPTCGKPLVQGKRFCGHCGARIAAA